MKKQVKLLFLLLIANCLVTPIICKEFLSHPSDNIKDILITSDYYINYYGSAYFNSEFNFLCSTATHKVANPSDITLVHYSLADEKVERKSILVEGFSDHLYYFTITSTNRLYFVYQISIKNESTGEYDHKMFCYYYNSMTKETDNFLLDDLSDHYDTHVTGIKTQADEVVFLVYDNIYDENRTIITTKILDKNEIKQTNTSNVLGGGYQAISSCYLSTKNLAYILFEESKSDKFHLYTYNFTSKMLSLNSVFNFTSGMPNSFRSGTLLCDEASDSLYFVCPKLSDEIFNIALYQYNSTFTTFELVAEKNDCYGSIIHPQDGVLFHWHPPYYDVFINNSMINILYRTSIAHTSTSKIMLLKYSLDTSEWESAEITKDPLALYYQEFLYNATSQTYLDSYFICHQYEGSNYRTFIRNNVLTAFAFFGENSSAKFAPYLLRVVPITIYWTIISGIIVGSIITGTGLVIGIRALVRKTHVLKQE